MTLNTTITAIATLSLSLLAWSGEDADDIKVVANGLRIAGRPGGGDDSLRPFNGVAGTTVALLISSPKAELLQVEHKSSAISKFLDGKGNDLLAQPFGPDVKSDGMTDGATGFSVFPKISKDGKFCAIEVNSPNLPAKGTSQIKLEGIITVLTATQKAEHVQERVFLQSGTKILAPNLELTIARAEKPDFGDEPFGLTLRANNRELDDIAEIRFCKEDGAEIKSRRTGTMKIGALGNLTVEWSYNLSEKIEIATVKIYLWSDMQKKKVRFQLDVDAGL